MGTPDFAVPTLKKIVASDHRVAAVYTRAPRPAGRGKSLRQSSVADEVGHFSIPIFTPATLKAPEAVETARAHRADAAVVVAYGLILPKPVLDAFPLGCFNLHASLLPRWRGAAPIHRAIMAGDDETGVAVMKMQEGLDTGPIASERRVQIEPDATTGDLRKQLAEIGANIMLDALAALEGGTLTFRPQRTEGVTYANKIDKNETRIDWNRPCKEVHDHCRGLSPEPGAWFDIPSIGRVKVLRTAIATGNGSPGLVLENKPTIACGKGAVRLVEVQRAGGKTMSADAFWRGLPSLESVS